MKNKKTSRRKWSIFLIVLVVLAALVAAIIGLLNLYQAQSTNEDPKYWENEVAKIESRYDGNYLSDVVVFLGSSSIRKWSTLAQDMAPIPVVNHGFGGSKINDSTYYLDRLVFPFQPRAVVLFAGTNDINGIEGSSKTGQQVYGGFVRFVEAVRATDPALPIYYISITPTPSRWKIWSDALEANQLIASYAETQTGVTFVDTTDQLLGADGLPNKDLFQWDNLHLNADGYAIWTSIIKPILIEDLGD